MYLMYLIIIVRSLKVLEPKMRGLFYGLTLP